jgi:hypothetical protein
MLPFAVLGLMAVGSGLQQGLQGRWTEGLTQVLFGTVFAGFAAGVVTLLLAALKKHR